MPRRRPGWVPVFRPNGRPNKDVEPIRESIFCQRAPADLHEVSCPGPWPLALCRAPLLNWSPLPILRRSLALSLTGERGEPTLQPRNRRMPVIG